MQSMTTARFQLDHESGISFRWRGGEYIDVGAVQDQGPSGIDGDDFHAYDVINVWDYEKGEPRIARTLDAFTQAVEDYIAEQE